MDKSSSRDKLHVQLNAVDAYIKELELVAKEIIPKKGKKITDAYFNVVNELRKEAGMSEIKKYTAKEKKEMMKRG